MAKRKNKNKPRPVTGRNWIALHAKGLTGRRGAGKHPDRKKAANKTACRGKVRYE